MQVDLINNYINRAAEGSCFGGLRLMQVNYTDAEWADYVDSLGGELDYK